MANQTEDNNKVFTIPSLDYLDIIEDEVKKGEKWIFDSCCFFSPVYDLDRMGIQYKELSTKF